MHPYRERPPEPDEPQPPAPAWLTALVVARWMVLLWAILRGVVAAYDGAASKDVYLALALVLAVAPGAISDVRRR